MTQLMQQFDRLISCHRRKIVKEFVERMASRQIVKQTLHRNTGSGKYGGTAHYIRRTRNSACFNRGVHICLFYLKLLRNTAAARSDSSIIAPTAPEKDLIIPL